jgi:tRNA (mo5U34)-methyltransferase
MTDAMRARIDSLGPWFHNLDLNGVWTAPDHFLGDFPSNKFQGFAHALPADLTGKSVLDIGSNGGFYCLEMKRRGWPADLVDKVIYRNPIQFLSQCPKFKLP